MKFRFIFWVIIIRAMIAQKINLNFITFRFNFWAIIALMMEAARTSETLVDNYFTRQYIPETILNFILTAVRT
jgi:hypothetical protein